MGYYAQIVNNKTGEVVYDYNEGDMKDEWFLWAEGNNSCDCARGLFFHEAKGEELTESEDYPCGDGVLFSVPVLFPNKLDDCSFMVVDGWDV